MSGLRDLTATVLWLLGAVLALLATGLLVAASVRVWRDRRRAELVIAPLENATSDPATDRAAAGITHRLREELVQTLPALAGRWTEMVERSRRDAVNLLEAVAVDGDDPLAVRLVEDINASQRQLTESIDSLAPESARGALRIVTQALLSPRGVRVSGVLQQTGHAPGGVGLSLTVNPLQTHGTARLVTLWEDPTAAVAGTDVVQRVHGLVVPAARALACELLRQQLTTRAPTARRLRLPRRSGAGDRAEQETRRRQAVVDFVTGRVYLEAAHTCAPSTVSFYRLSERALRRSQAQLDHYKVPYLRGVAVAELGKREADPQRAVKQLAEAQELLGRARELLAEAELPEAYRTVEELKISALTAATRCWVVTKLPDEAEQVAAAVEALSTLEQVDFSDPAFRDQSSALYNVACAFAAAASVLALGLAPDRWRTDAKRSLIHACLQQDWWHDAATDPDLAVLHDWLPRAERLLRARLAGAAAPPDARTVVEAVLAASDGLPLSAGDPAGRPPARTATDSRP